MKRYQVSAVPIGGGERVTGYPVKYGETWQIWVEREDGTWNYVIDPATIEPVKVPVSIGENGNIYCPCCKSKIGILRGLKYCSHCGQALDWTKELRP